MLTDDVGGKDAKRFVIPNGTPVMDIGADGKTVSFFGTAPESADKLSLQIKDIASFGETIRLGNVNDSSRTLLSTEGMSIYDGDEEMVHFGRAGSGWTDDDPLSPRGYHFSFGSRVTDTTSRNTAMYSFSAGRSLNPARNYQTVVGEYNQPDDSSLFVVGNGSSNDNRSNAFIVNHAGISSFGDIWAFRNSDTNQGTNGSTCLYDAGIGLYNKNGYDCNIEIDGSGEVSLRILEGTDFKSIFSFLPNGAFSINGRDICENKVLWSGAWYMTNDHTAYLDESISDQPNGIVLVFSAYRGNNAENYHWCTFFVPKYLISYSDRGFNCPLINNVFTNVACKYIYISDSQITGHNNNASSGSASGISYNNRYYVMRYVIGV